MKNFVVKTIFIDKVMPSGNYYPREVMEKAIKEFNERAKDKSIVGGEVDRKNLSFKNWTHLVKGAEIQDGMLQFYCEILNTPEGRKLQDRIANSTFIPMMTCDLNQPEIVDGKKVITKIHYIRGLGVEIKEDSAMNINETIIKIQAGKNVSCVPMGEGNLFYRIVVDGKTIMENLSKLQAEDAIDKAKNRVLID